jgi:hypothetical protein
MNSITVFTGTNGLNTNVDPAHLPVRGKTQPLIECMNVTVGDTGRPSRILGRTKQTSTTGHSLYEYHGKAYFVSNSTLYRIDTQSSYAALASLSNNQPVRFIGISDGFNDVIFYSNGVDTGRIINGAAASWTKGTYAGPDTNRTFYGPPAGMYLHYQYGRTFIANGNHVWWSEPFNPYLYDMVRNRFTFESRIRMLIGVNDGLWVSDSERIYFIAGNFSGDPVQLSERSTYPAVHGVPVKVNISEMNFQNLYGIGHLCFTQNGMCLLAPGGIFINRTHDNLELRDEALKPYIFDRYWAFNIGNHVYFNIETRSSGGTFPTAPSLGGDTMDICDEITSDTVLALGDLECIYPVYSTSPTNITITIPEVSSSEASQRLKFIKRGTGGMIIRTTGGQTMLSPFGSGTTATDDSTTTGSWLFLQVINDEIPWSASSMGSFDFS